MEAAMEACAAGGKAVFVAAGDSGSGDGESGSNAEAALKAVYNADGKTLAQAYANSLPAGGVKKGKK